MEPHLLGRLQEDESDDAAWLALADWLEEYGDPERAARVRAEVGEGTPGTVRAEGGLVVSYRRTFVHTVVIGEDAPRPLPVAAFAREPFLRQVRFETETLAAADLEPLADAPCLVALTSVYAEPESPEVFARLYRVPRVPLGPEHAAVHAERDARFDRLPEAERRAIARSWARLAGTYDADAGRLLLGDGFGLAPIVSAELRFLRDLPDLRELLILDGALDGGVVDHLGNLPELRELLLGGQSLSSLGPIPSRAPKLRALDLAFDTMPDAALAGLETMGRLESLALRHGELSARSLRRVLPLRGLRFLSLAGVREPDGAEYPLGELAALRELRELVLDGVTVDGDDLSSLCGCTAMERLSLFGCLPHHDAVTDSEWCFASLREADLGGNDLPERWFKGWTRMNPTIVGFDAARPHADLSWLVPAECDGWTLAVPGNLSAVTASPGYRRWRVDASSVDRAIDTRVPTVTFRVWAADGTGPVRAQVAASHRREWLAPDGTTAELACLFDAGGEWDLAFEHIAASVPPATPGKDPAPTARRISRSGLQPDFRPLAPRPPARHHNPPLPAARSPAPTRTEDRTPMKPTLALAALLAAASALYAADAVPAPTAAPSAIERMRADLTYLAGPECEGRGVETKGIHKAADFAAARFKQLGLQPIPQTGEYFQPFKIAGAVKLAGTNTAAVATGPGAPAELKMGQEGDFEVSSLTASGTFSGGVVFAGYGATIPGAKYDDYAGVDVTGKAVIIIRRLPGAGGSKPLVAPADDEASPLSAKVANAIQHKAAAILFVNDADQAKDRDELMTFAYGRGQAAGTVPVVHLRRSLVSQLLQAGAKRSLAEVEKAIEQSRKPLSLPLTGVSVKLQTTVNREGFPAKNVVGVLPGAGPLADETIVIGAHYDHLGFGEPGSLARAAADRKKVHWGADDNGSGTTTVLELARRFAGIKDRQGRRIVFVLFSGEERGLLGSAHYCDKPVFPLEKTAAMINLDMVGRLREGKIQVWGVGTAKVWEPTLDRLNKDYGFKFQKIQSGGGPSDHASFNRKSVPVCFLFTDVHAEYHRPTDTVDTINFDGMAKICEMVERLAGELCGGARPAYVKSNAPTPSPGGRPRVPSIKFAPGSYDEAEERGVLVGEVRPDGPAAKAGLKDGDFIVTIAGQPVKNMENYMAVMGKQKAGVAVKFGVQRGKEKLELTVTPE